MCASNQLYKTTTWRSLTRIITAVSFALANVGLMAAERTEYFDADPQWDARNNRAVSPEPQQVEQDFRYRETQHAGGERAGEIGGLLTPAAEPTYYAKPLKELSFDDGLSASGNFIATGRHFHVLVGFFNTSTVNEWRVPNSIVLRLYGRGDVFYAYVEYATSRWRAGGDSPGGFATVIDPETGRPQLRGFARDQVHNWSLTYDPTANGGDGAVIAKIDGETAVCNLDLGHKADGATFNRFGVLNIPKHFDQGGEVWLDDISVNGEVENFDIDPGWEAVGTPRTYTTHSVRPRFNFGFSQTSYAGGRRSGELGGEIFRGDARSPTTMAYYGDRLNTVSLAKPLQAGGRVAMRRGISDSTVLIGFFHSQHSMAVSPSPSTGFPKNLVGVAIEGPSREGFFFYPVCHTANGNIHYASGSDLPRIMPNGESAEWKFQYEPLSNDAGSRITVQLGDSKTALELTPAELNRATDFDRFGIVTTWIDGNSQHVYFDDLTYTFEQ
jgi:hypothetical protein